MVDLSEEILVANATEERKEAAETPEPMRACDEIRARGSFGEPYEVRVGRCGTVGLYVASGLFVTSIATGIDDREKAERIAASVNFCAGFSTEELIRVVWGGKAVRA
jgi:hypothetical protein